MMACNKRQLIKSSVNKKLVVYKHLALNMVQIFPENENISIERCFFSDSPKKPQLIFSSTWFTSDHS